MKILKDPFSSVISYENYYHGRNWYLSDNSVLGYDGSFDVLTTFFDGEYPVTLQACTPGLAYKGYSFNMEPFKTGSYFPFPMGGSFFSGRINFLNNNGLQGNMFIDGNQDYVVIAAEKLNIQFN